MGYRKGHGALKGYSYREFEKTLNDEGFYFHHVTGTHAIFTNAEGYYVTVTDYGKKEVNHMMSTVTLQRIKNGMCRRDVKYKAVNN